jgi:hypothetical protein
MFSYLIDDAILGERVNVGAEQTMTIDLYATA